MNETKLTWPPALPFSTVLARARAMDQQAVSLLYRRFLPVVYRFALARVGNPHTAEDVTSDTFFAMLESMNTVQADDELGFAAWLLGIARNKTLMHFRHQRGQPRLVSGYPEQVEVAVEADDPLHILTARESWDEVVVALDRLTEEQRSVVLYRCVLGYSAEEVGEMLGRQAGTIRALQFRALASLARVLGIEQRRTTSSRAGKGQGYGTRR
ncbi:MAG: RNA polymerase subunit sigma-24 [Chloroflexi bacterium]|nr:MAG: RNA polymerase subunit sigma-24 [Chloroflexota bacterium]